MFSRLVGFFFACDGRVDLFWYVISVGYDYMGDIFSFISSQHIKNIYLTRNLRLIYEIGLKQNSVY